MNFLFHSAFLTRSKIFLLQFISINIMVNSLLNQNIKDMYLIIDEE
jgi:hypothetical protein